MELIQTYIVCDSNMNRKLMKIDGFVLNLGHALTERKKGVSTFDPVDAQIQSHYVIFKEIVNRIGNIGLLNIYNKGFIPYDELHIINNGLKLVYKYDEQLTAFQNVNNAIAKFRETYEVEPPKKESVKEYVKPNKKMSEMSENERIAFARNLK